MTNCDVANSYELTVLSDLESCNRIEKLIDSSKKARPWKVRKCEWDIKYLETELAEAHIAIIPSDPNSMMKKYASHNRVVDAIQAGCMVIASPLKSYLELKRCILIADNGVDFATLMNSGLQEYGRLTYKWDKYRSNILSRFKPEVNLKNWENCLNLATKNKYL